MSDSRQRVLIVEDDRALVGLLTLALSAENFEVQAAYDAASAVRHYRAEPPDLVVLDLGLPDATGDELCRRLVAHGSAPVLILSGRKDEATVVSLLDAGADDYITKPFRSVELLARIRAALRREPSPTHKRGRLVIAGLVIDLGNHDVHAAGERVALTPMEFRLLHALATRAGDVVTHAQLAAAGWPRATYTHRTLVKPHVARLRRKLAGHGGPLPRSVRGFGYRLA
jgi:two-component system KDP operon response regulator KdpE